MKISREVKIGFLVVLALGLLYFGLNFLKGIDIFDKQQVYHVQYNSVNGLETSNPVVINGYQVGIVRKIKLLKEKQGQLVVTFALNEDFELPKDTKARLQSADLLGSMQVNLLLGRSNEMAANGDTLRGEVESGLKEAVNEQIRPLKNRAENLISSMDSTLTIVQSILDEDAQGNLTASFRGLKDAIGTVQDATRRMDTLIARESRSLGVIFDNVESISTNLRENNEEISNIMANLSQVSDTLAQANIAQTINNANSAINGFDEIVGRIERGEGSLGLLVNNDTLYDNLESASKQLDLLIEDIRVHPKRYVHFSIFGRKEQGTKLTRKELQQLEKYLDEQEEKEE